MSVAEIIGWVVVSMLAAYLYFKQWQRLQGGADPPDRAGWTGTSIDASRLKPTVELVRHNYLAARPPLQGGNYHKSLIGLARQAVLGLAYFRERRTDGLVR